jgi:pimeloyl-ACP methyl ester carboxylesterase
MPEIKRPPADSQVDGAGGILADDGSDRSIVSSLKLAFFKWRAGKDTNEGAREDKLNAINQLCWVEYHDDGTISRRSDDITDKVATAKNPLLVIHGFTGDTDAMAASLPNIVAQNGRSVTDEYDLILTYDYENLTTSIQDTADLLKGHLKDAGITADKGLTILAHSMGGLVSRYFIEKLEGDKLVKQLVMAGTPNAGSPFGKLADWIDSTKNVLNMAITFMPGIIPTAARFLAALRLAQKGLDHAADGAEKIKTLPQMKPGSDFLTELNGPASTVHGVRYSIVAGDASIYRTDEKESRMKRFFDKVLVEVGDLANVEHKHDTVVSLKSIKNSDVWKGPGRSISEADLLTVACHHINYFTTDAGRNALASVLIS